MRRPAPLLLALVLISGSVARALETPPPAPPPSAPSAEQPASAPTTAAQEVLRLKEAGYSEEFLLNKIHRENKTYALSTDDLVTLRKAGLSETVIEALLRSGNPSATPAAAPASAPSSGAASSAPAAASTAAPSAQTSSGAPEVSAAASPAPSPSAAPALTADLGAGSQSFDGLVRQKHGFLGIGGSKKKAIGKLVVDREQLHWYQTVDPEDNFSSFVKNIKEMWMNCAPRAGENLCLELCFKTYSGDEWCFRDTGWGDGTNRQVTAVFDYFQKTFPATFFSKREKKSF